jgi:uncharacterized membrane protein YfcA
MSWSGIILVIVGALLLANNFDLLPFAWLRQWWPVLLIALGLMSLLRPQRGRRSSRVDRDDESSARRPDDRP